MRPLALLLCLAVALVVGGCGSSADTGGVDVAGEVDACAGIADTLASIGMLVRVTSMAGEELCGAELRVTSEYGPLSYIHENPCSWSFPANSGTFWIEASHDGYETKTVGPLSLPLGACGRPVPGPEVVIELVPLSGAGPELDDADVGELVDVAYEDELTGSCDAAMILCCDALSGTGELAACTPGTAATKERWYCDDMVVYSQEYEEMCSVAGPELDADAESSQEWDGAPDSVGPSQDAASAVSDSDIDAGAFGDDVSSETAAQPATSDVAMSENVDSAVDLAPLPDAVPATCCDDGNPCTKDGCLIGGGCTHQMIKDCTTPCTYYTDCPPPAHACLTSASCPAGVCVYSSLTDVADGDACSLKWCTAEAGLVEFSDWSCGPMDCLIDSDCTVLEAVLPSCGNYVCAAAGVCDVVTNCDDGDPCTLGVCHEAGDCDHLPIPGCVE